MSLQLAAQHLASRGRGPDTQLIHMAPQEVAGLHALAKAHGGSLTTNPDTGLPEAGFLSSILPMVIGAGLSIASGGALTPLMAAGITGAGYGVATGSLSKGLMAGLGAFGGAGLGAGLAGAGAGAAGTGLAETGLTASGGVMGANPMLAQPMTFATPSAGLSGAALGPDILGGTAEQLGAAYGYTPSPIAAAIPPPAAVAPVTAMPTPVPPTAAVTPEAMSIGDRFSQAGRGIQSLGSGQGISDFVGEAATKTTPATGMGGIGATAKSGLMALAPAITEMMTPQQKAEEEKAKLKPFEYRYSSGYNPTPDEGYTGAQTGERRHFDHRFVRTAAGGGLMDIQPIEAMSQQNQAQMQPAYAQGGVSDMAVNPYTGSEAFAEGGLSHLGDYSDGGRLLRGPGDGVSDSIPASIGDKRPARLADGEFVVPARIVSELGNGSTEAGARKLYAMMDRVQKARAKTTGKDRVAANTKAERLLPV
jgi:hypothetical protein